MAVQYQTQDCSFRFSGRRKTTDWIRRTAKAEGHRTGDITVVFCSDTALLEINRRYLVARIIILTSSRSIITVTKKRLFRAT